MDLSGDIRFHGRVGEVAVRLRCGEGRRRLYVRGSEGHLLGWCDPDRGVEVIEPGVPLLWFRTVIAGYLRTHRLKPRSWGDPAAVPVGAFDVASHEPSHGPAMEAKRLRSAGRRTEAKAWEHGAAGERVVGRALMELPPVCRVLHGLPVRWSGSDIDHLVITPGGVYVFNAKHHDGKDKASVWCEGGVFYARGHATNHLEASRREARLVATRLSAAAQSPILATPVIAVVGAEVQHVEVPGDVLVIPASHLVRWLLSCPAVYSQETIDRLYGWARTSSTWLIDGPPVVDERSEAAEAATESPARSGDGSWHRDPYHRFAERWFDGETWTGRVRDERSHLAFDTLLGRKRLPAPERRPATL